jgi:hypothetical protein
MAKIAGRGKARASPYAFPNAKAALCPVSRIAFSAFQKKTVTNHRATCGKQRERFVLNSQTTRRWNDEFPERRWGVRHKIAGPAGRSCFFKPSITQNGGFTQ